MQYILADLHLSEKYIINNYIDKMVYMYYIIKNINNSKTISMLLYEIMM